MNKFTKLISSLRFQQILVVGILQALVLFKVISSEQGTGLANILSYVLGTSVVIGTYDRAQDKKVEAAQAVSPVYAISATPSYSTNSGTGTTVLTTKAKKTSKKK